MKRNKIVYTIAILVVVMLGLFSRSNSSFQLPALVKQYAGDTLWALVAYLIIGFLFPRLSIIKVAVAAGVFSFAIELSQLYQGPWIDKIRQMRLGGLLLGHGFLWSDLICYLAGICIGVLMEYCWERDSFLRNQPANRFNKK